MPESSSPLRPFDRRKQRFRYVPMVDLTVNEGGRIALGRAVDLCPAPLAPLSICSCAHVLALTSLCLLHPLRSNLDPLCSLLGMHIIFATSGITHSRTTFGTLLEILLAVAPVVQATRGRQAHTSTRPHPVDALAAGPTGGVGIWYTWQDTTVDSYLSIVPRLTRDTAQATTAAGSDFGVFVFGGIDEGPHWKGPGLQEGYRLRTVNTVGRVAPPDASGAGSLSKRHHTQ